MKLAHTILAGALALLATASTSADARRTDIDHVGLYNFAVEISGVAVAGFQEVVELDGHGGDGPVLALEDGVATDDLLWASADAAGGPLELTLVEQDEKGRSISRERMCATPLTVVLDDPKAGPVAASSPGAIEQAAGEITPDDEYGIVIYVIYVGSCDDEE